MELILHYLRRYRALIIGLTVGILLSATLLAAFLVVLDYQKPIPGRNGGLSPMAPSLPEIGTRAISNPDREVRGVWIASVSNINYPSKKGLSEAQLKAELDDIINTCVELKLNTIFFQVRPASDALYTSSLFPASEYVSGTQGQGSFDSLAYLIEQAEPYNIDIHAWVNPLRVTASQKNALSDLSPDNPAALHPEYLVSYNGLLYYNAGLPEVRELIAAGVREIVENYDVKGVVFDDYFYPYPVSGQVFDDGDAYDLYGGELSVGNWRRDNVNQMVKACYDAVKDVRSHCKFGIAPFGIWDNDDGKNFGSATNGLSAYDSLFCDALAWIDGGYIDYIAPQLYWQFTTSVARFDTLIRWWNAALEGTDVDLMVSHAAYQSTTWNSDSEIMEQVSFARSERAYQGSIHYGYAAIKANEMNLQGQLKSLYEHEIIYPDIVSDGSELVISSPSSGTYMNVTETYILGTSDPAEPVYLNGRPISRTKNGHFSLFVSLNKGENKFIFTHKGVETVYIINRGKAPSQSTASKPAALDEFALTSLAPASNVMLSPGSVVTLRATAPAGSDVTATVFGKTVKLSPTLKPKGSGMLKEIYETTVKIPDVSSGTVKDFGNITYTAVYKGKKITAQGVSIRGVGKGGMIAVEVTNNDSQLKISETSWYYDDYTPASAGMRDMAVSLQNGYYKLRLGGYVAAENVKEIEGEVPLAAVEAGAIAVEEQYTRLQLKVTAPMPVNGYLDGDTFVLTLMNMDTSLPIPAVSMTHNPLFSAIKGEKHPTRGDSIRYYLTLHDQKNFYGFECSYEFRENGDIFFILSLRNPTGLSADPALPLSGKRIVLDAGHGGSDSGTLGPNLAFTESDLNLAIVLAAKDKLTALGAEVILVREEDTTVSIYNRLDSLCVWNPDLCVSVHQNSMDYTADITKIRGLLALYWSDSGVLLTEQVSAAMASALNRYERTPQKQKLALVRNAKFPSTLVEVGFITSVEEYDQLASEVGIDAAANGLVSGIVSYYEAQAKYRAAFGG